MNGFVAACVYLSCIAHAIMYIAIAALVFMLDDWNRKNKEVN